MPQDNHPSATDLFKNLICFQLALYVFLFVFLTYHSQFREAFGPIAVAGQAFQQEKLFDIWPTHLNRMADYQTIMNVKIKRVKDEVDDQEQILSNFDLRVHPFFQKQSVWEKMPIIEEDEKEQKIVAKKLVSLQDYLSKEEENEAETSKDHGREDEDDDDPYLLILMTEEEYSTVDESSLLKGRQNKILGLLIVREEKYFIIQIADAFSVLFNFDFASMFEMLQVKIQYKISKYYISKDAVELMQQYLDKDMEISIYEKLTYSLPAVENMEVHLFYLFILYCLIVCASSFLLQPQMMRTIAMNGYVNQVDTISIIRMTMMFKLVSIFMQLAYTWKLNELLQTFDKEKKCKFDIGDDNVSQMILYKSSPFLSLTQMVHSFSEILFMTICSLNFTFICLRLKYLIGLAQNVRRAWNITESQFTILTFLLTLSYVTSAKYYIFAGITDFQKYIWSIQGSMLIVIAQINIFSLQIYNQTLNVLLMWEQEELGNIIVDQGQVTHDQRLTLRNDIVRKKTLQQTFQAVLTIYWIAKLVELTGLPLYAIDADMQSSFRIKQCTLYTELFCFMALLIIFRPYKNTIQTILNSQNQQEVAYGLLPLLLDQEYIENNIQNQQQMLQLPKIHSAELIEQRLMFKTPESQQGCDDNFERVTPQCDNQQEAQPDQDDDFFLIINPLVQDEEDTPANSQLGSSFTLDDDKGTRQTESADANLYPNMLSNRDRIVAQMQYAQIEKR